MYEIKELSLADTRRLYDYMQAGTFGSDFNLKGFDYPWILRSHDWKKGEHVLDVGAAFSELPIEIANRYGCEVWAADDFGRSEGDTFWERGRDPAAHIQRHPEVHYVLERLGDPAGSSLPLGYFDCIYSASTLEHVPSRSVLAVWRHMDLLLRPGGEMLHALDIAFPTSRGPWHVLMALAFDSFHMLMPKSLRRRFSYETPKNYARLLLGAIDVQSRRLPRSLGILNMVLNPEILTESPEHTYNRIIKDGKTDARHFRVASLLIHLKKI